MPEKVIALSLLVVVVAAGVVPAVGGVGLGLKVLRFESHSWQLHTPSQVSHTDVNLHGVVVVVAGSGGLTQAITDSG